FPLALPGRCIALTTEPGDLVLDPFLGSGSTALAAVELGRRCIGFDISEKYIRLSEERVKLARAERSSKDPLKGTAADRHAPAKLDARRSSGTIDTRKRR